MESVRKETRARYANKYYSSNSAGGSYKEHRTMVAAIKRGVDLGHFGEYGILDSYKQKLTSGELEDLENEMEEIAEDVRFSD